MAAPRFRSRLNPKSSQKAVNSVEVVPGDDSNHCQIAENRIVRPRASAKVIPTRDFPPPCLRRKQVENAPFYIRCVCRELQAREQAIMKKSRLGESTVHSDQAVNGTSLSGFVQVRGAREHNLKNIDVDIPRDALVVFTGISGSGKSSLAFGTLYAEAQRRYLESVNPYARRLFHQMQPPQV